MLINRIQEGDAIKALYESSNVVASKYNTKTNDLSVVFKGGQEYIYSGVSASDYSFFELSESQGSALNKRIKSYAFSKGEKVDVEELKEAVKKAKISEISYMEVELANACKVFAASKEVAGDGLADGAILDVLISLATQIKEKKRGLNA